MEFLPESFKTREAFGIHLRGKTIHPYLPPRLSLLVFLRHSGCIFVREAIADLKEMFESSLSFPSILFFFPEDLKNCEKFFKEVWKDACVVSDPNTEFYQDLGLQNANLIQLAGPKVWMGVARATLKGHFYGIPGSNPLQMPGAFLVVQDRIVWEHRYRHIGDHPDWKNLPGITLLPGPEFGPGVLPA
ncbi:peroxiredoxin-like family protein [Leptospira noguchii]|uniref:AhpC/TSA antioxidant enzyme n=1 Tax=Leptospira noguchii str. 2001034031 TaxID=1193053 RepID=M6YTU1_9LEPT|nr:peroxiredoxin-like family protein [Leptospira noguchii]EMO89793.1 AhpC/TSA antioxidant enzyme [Leptospira noguchii str. 2001034031]